MDWVDMAVLDKIEELLTGMAGALDANIIGVHGESHLLCPHDLRVHGRSVEAILPLIWLSQKTGDATIMKRAEALYHSSRVFKNRSGGWENDLAFVRWPGTTVFWLEAIGSVIGHYADRLNARFLNELKTDYEEAVHFIGSKFNIDSAVTNYTFAAACVFLEAQKILGPSATLDGYAQNSLSKIAKVFDEDGLIFGEGYPRYERTANGFRPVDITYNIDESLLYLYRIAQLTGAPEYGDLFIKTLGAHWPFFLKDGGIDGSVGSRAFKWTYWGSRTTRGIVEPLMAIQKDSLDISAWLDSHIGVVAENSKDGLLLGGPSYIEKGDATACIQHTIFRAVALTNTLLHLEQPLNPSLLSGVADINFADNHRNFRDAGILLHKSNGWHVSSTVSDFEYGKHCSIASVLPALVWHENIGPLLSAAIDPDLPPEPHNSQHQPKWQIEDSTARLEFSDGAETSKGAKNLVLKGMTANGWHVGSHNSEGQNYECALSFDKDIVMKIKSERPAELYLPVISGGGRKVIVQDRKVIIQRGDYQAIISLESDDLNTRFEDAAECMTYNPGFMHKPIRTHIKANENVSIKIEAGPK